MCRASYKRWRRREIAYGRWQPRVDVGAAREHVDALIRAGLRPAQIADLAGISKATVGNITHPDAGRVHTDIARAVLAVPVPERAGAVAADNARVPIVGARRRVQALVAYGYPQAHLARELGMNPAHTTMAALVDRPNRRSGATGQSVTAKRDREIKALFDRLQLEPGPSDKARDYGRERGWPLPFEWDEDTIDQPDAQPTRAQWTPASSRDERRAQVQELTGLGVPAWEIATRLGVTERTVVRARRLTPAGAPDRPELDWGLDR